MPDVEVEGPDGNTYQFPDGTDKNAAIRYFKAKGIGVSRSASSPIPPPPVQRPNIPVEKEYLLGGGKVRPITESVGELAEGALKSTGHLAAVTPVVAHRILQKHGIMGPGSRLFPGEHTMEQVEKEDVPNAALTVLGGIEDIGETRRPSVARPARTSTIPEPPRAAPLDPESQAKYTAAIDKTNQEFKEQSVGYHEKVSKAFDEAKREQLEATAKHGEATKKAIEDHRQAAKDYHEKLTDTFDKAKRTQLEKAAKYEKEHADWLEESSAYHKASAEAEASAQRQRGLHQSAKENVQKTFDNLQQVYKSARGDLSQRWKVFRKSMEGAELEPTRTFNLIEAAKTKYLKGSPASLTAFNNLAREMGIQEFMEGEGGDLKAIPGTGKLPFDTARVHYSAIGDKLAQGDLPGNVYQALKAVQEGLDQQLTQAAEGRGLGKTYETLKSEESQFLSDWEDSKSPLAKAHKALDQNFLEPHVMGRGNEYLTKQLERYRKYGAQPHLPLAARRLMEESKATPKLKLPPEPGPEPMRPLDLPEHTPPGSPRESTVPPPPGLPEKTIPKRPELKEVARPKPKTPEPKGTGRVARAIRRGTMKIVGGHVAGFPGYVLGGEADSALEEAIRRKSTLPPPPE